MRTHGFREARPNRGGPSTERRDVGKDNKGTHRQGGGKNKGDFQHLKPMKMPNKLLRNKQVTPFIHGLGKAASCQRHFRAPPPNRQELGAAFCVPSASSQGCFPELREILTMSNGDNKAYYIEYL